MHPRAYRITDSDVVAILTDRARFRAKSVWAVPEVPGGGARYAIHKTYRFEVLIC